MVTTYIDIVFKGRRFSPGRLAELTGLKLEILAEYNKIAGKGRYKGQKSPFGLALLKIESSISEDLNAALERVTDKLLKDKQYLNDTGVDEITLDLENYSQKEFEITIDKKIIQKISKLNANIDISNSYTMVDLLDSYWQANPNFVSDYNYGTLQENMFEDLIKTVYYHQLKSKILSNSESERLQYILKEKFDNTALRDSKIPLIIIVGALIIYIGKYMHEGDLDKVPDFNEVLRTY